MRLYLAIIAASLICSIKTLKAQNTSNKDKCNLSLSFNSRASTGAQQKSLKVLVSSNFSGVYTPESIAKAEWTDISDEINLAKGVVKQSSGPVELTELCKSKYIYLAFKYEGKTHARLVQPNWEITDLKLVGKSKAVDSKSIITDPRKAWQPVSIINPSDGSPVTWVLNVGGLILKAGKINADPVEQWVITKKIDLQKFELVP